MRFWTPPEGAEVRLIEPASHPFTYTPAENASAEITCTDLPDCMPCQVEQEEMAAEAIRRCRLF